MKIQRPKPTGEYAVGTLTYTVCDAREEVINPGTMRSVPARVYYPVWKDTVSGLSQPRTLSPNVVTGIKKVFHLPICFDRMEKTGENVSECYENAPFIEGEHFPLILFNHGLYSYREENSFLCIELASHGYAVISVTHPLEASCAEFDDGTVIFADKKVTAGRYQPFWKAYLELKRFEKMKGTDKELSDRFSELERLYCRRENDRIEEWMKDNEAALGYAKEHFSELIDFSKGIGAAGLSMGGNTSYRLCARNKEFACGVNIDGGLFGDYSEDVLKKPFLQINCRANRNASVRAFLRHTEPVFGVIFRDMKHMGFSDMKHMMKSGNTMGRLSPGEMHENLCRCFLEFFDAYLKHVKAEPEIKSNDVITVTRYEADL